MQRDEVDRVSLEFLRSVKALEKISSSPPQYLVERQGRTLLLERRGTCDYERCRALCCRMLCLDLEWNDYLAGFAEKGVYGSFIYKTCRYLSDDFTCKRWNTSDFPRACYNFPVPGDPMYLEVMDTCSFFFLVLREVKINDHMDRQTG